MSAESRRAGARLVCIGGTRPTDPVAAADWLTSMADARAALCIARGVPLDDIDPTTGQDLSRRAYDTVHRDWRQLLAGGPLSDYMRCGYQQTRALWAAKRPEYVAAGDWPDAA